MKYNGKPIDLTPDQEELATMYAVMLNAHWVKKDVFNRNFFDEFKQILNDKKNQERVFPEIIDLNLCDFSDIYKWYSNKKHSKGN